MRVRGGIIFLSPRICGSISGKANGRNGPLVAAFGGGRSPRRVVLSLRYLHASPAVRRFSYVRTSLNFKNFVSNHPGGKKYVRNKYAHPMTAEPLAAKN